LKPIAKEWDDAGCGKCRQICPALLCKVQTGGICQKNSTTAAAIVDDRVVITPPIIINLNDGTCVNKSLVIQPVAL
jgi:hypothetical protein